MSIPPVFPGEVLNGKYRVGEVIGVGGVGIVVAADHLELGERVALKFLRDEVSRDENVVARFLREAKAAVRIKSEHVARVLDVARTPKGIPFFVMELLEGRDLQSEVETKGRLPVKDAVEYALHVCEALAMAHALGIVHRDIKPENLFLAERGHGVRVVKVLDFGISKAALTGSIFGDNIPLVRTQNLMGTPLYMSPEQVRNSESVDARSDVWALGMTLFELLTGTTAFMASSLTELSAQILEKEPAPIEQYRTDVPMGLSSAIYRCLEKNADQRFQNVAELAAAIAPYGPKRARVNVERASSVLHSAGMIKRPAHTSSTMPPPMQDVGEALTVPAPPALPSGPSLKITPGDLAVTPAPVPRQRERRRWESWLVIGGGVAVAAIIAIVIATQLRPPQRSSASTATTTTTTTTATIPSVVAFPAAVTTQTKQTVEPAATTTPTTTATAPPTTISTPDVTPVNRKPKLVASGSPSSTTGAAPAPTPTPTPTEPDLGY